MSVLKRQRELRKAEKASRKRAKRHGLIIEGSEEPRPTAEAAAIFGYRPPEGEEEPDDSPDEAAETEEDEPS
jgi:hypothetical protein